MLERNFFFFLHGNPNGVGHLLLPGVDALWVSNKLLLATASVEVLDRGGIYFFINVDGEGSLNLSENDDPLLESPSVEVLEEMTDSMREAARCIDPLCAKEGGEAEWLDPQRGAEGMMDKLPALLRQRQLGTGGLEGEMGALLDTMLFSKKISTVSDFLYSLFDKKFVRIILHKIDFCNNSIPNLSQ